MSQYLDQVFCWEQEFIVNKWFSDGTMIDSQEAVVWHSKGRNLQLSAAHLDQGLEQSEALYAQFTL